MRSRPYRNDRIIAIIRDMYFSGGAMSFARKFQYLFPTYETREGNISYKVPLPMVALVATAVSQLILWLLLFSLHTSSMRQSTSGALASSRLRSSQQTHILMFTLATSTP
jgi:hypothetical protein